MLGRVSHVGLFCCGCTHGYPPLLCGRQAGHSEKKARQLQAAGRAATCVRWEAMGRAKLGSACASGDDTISAADLAGTAPELDDMPHLRGDESRCGPSAM